MWLGGDAAGAYRYGLGRWADAPDETLASYLPQIAAGLPEVADGLAGIREALRGPGTCVTIEGPGGGRSFVIDEGPEFYGIAIEAPTGGLAALVGGKRAGDTFEIPKMTGDAVTWRITRVLSKYLHLQHLMMDQFEVRFPGARGIARFTSPEGDVSQVLDVVRRTSEVNRRVAQLYLDGVAPLAIVAHRLGATRSASPTT